MNKTFNTTILAAFFCMGSFGLYKWFTSKIIPESDLIPTKGKIIEISHNDDHHKDIIIRLENGSELFRFLERFPNYKQAQIELKVDSIVCIWHKPQPSKIYTMYRMDAHNETILSYADVARSYNKDSRNVLKAGVTFSVAFIVSLILRIRNKRKKRDNQALN